ncbi:YbaY family lipoprotein [Marinobacter fonticola]|uniref:YbaY family lipoprotein n=1 Tax=Marinobacter fonticola TaxID=2603215 RepID=UPI0011E78DA9|nr:YbaY family lipoprotein [Marinobacter fonticola]
MKPTEKRLSKLRSGPTAWVSALLAALLLSGCASDAHIWGGVPNAQQIEGTVSYRERMAVPPEAMVTVILEDVSLADAPSDVIARTSFRAENGPPWSFELDYDPREIMDSRRYNLRAKITNDDRLMFISTEANPVTPGEADTPVAIVVNRAGGRIAPVDQTGAAPVELVNTFWELKGLYGDPIRDGADQRKLNIVLMEENDRVAGFSGCNQFSGGYEREGNQLAISQLTVTQMACFQGMEREENFHQALQDTVRYTLKGPVLQLYDADEEVVLEFVAGQ